MLKFCVKVFRTSFFSKIFDEFVHVGYDDRYWSKVLCSTIQPTLHALPPCDLKVKDLEFLCQSFMLKCLELHYFKAL